MERSKEQEGTEVEGKMGGGTLAGEEGR